MSRHRFTPEATRDLREIGDFIAENHPTAALRILDEIEARCRALARMPATGRPREELAVGLRSSVVGKYLIFYRPAAGGIEVIRIAHGARDLPGLFGR